MNKDVALRLYNEVWNQKKLAVIDEIFADDFAIFAPGIVVTDKKVLKEFIHSWMTSFPDIHHEVEDVVEQGNKLALRFKGKGTHLGQFMDLAPTHKGFSYTGMNFMHFEGGKIKKLWLNSSIFELVAHLREHSR